jgi:ornithine carbamoyltransferase
MTVRHFRRVSDLTTQEVDTVFMRAAEMKRSPLSDILAGKTVALVFSKPSTRTRVSFSVGVYQMGGMPLFLGESELQMRKSESIEDTARVLSRYVDAIVIRTFAQSDVDDLAANATVPVINALTDQRHPCQGLTDLFTFEERFPDARGRQITYLGDGNNVAESLAAAGAMRGVNVCLAVPEGYDLTPELWDELQALATAQGVRIWVERDPFVAVKGASALYTDVWISMGQAKAEDKIGALTPYRIDAALVAAASPEAIVMHCLPAHRGDEITSEVMDGRRSVVFDQAENRLHVQKALMLLLLGG